MSLARLAAEQAPAHHQGLRPLTAGRSKRDDRFDLLTKYIPTETVTLFVAAMSALKAIRDVWPIVDGWTLYWVGAGLTPVVFLLAAYGKHLSSGSGTPFRPAIWPMVASLIAFLAWGLSVPGLLQDDSAKVVAAFGAVLVSTALSLLEPIFLPRPTPVDEA